MGCSSTEGVQLRRRNDQSANRIDDCHRRHFVFNSKPIVNSLQSDEEDRMKPKKLQKKIQRLEKRLREGPAKLAKLRQQLQQAEAAKALKAARKSAVRATAAARTPVVIKIHKKKPIFSPERRAQLAAAMKARWAARRAASAAKTTPDSGAQDSTQQAPNSPPSEGGGDGA
jgi:hypothetical protein